MEGHTFISENPARQALTEGRKIAAIIATMGTTDSVGLDDLQAIAAMRDALANEFRLAYRPHIHADAVIGWVWSVFNDYDCDGNPLGFRPRILRALAGACRRIRHLALADSVGVDFHKTGFAPYLSSLVSPAWCWRRIGRTCSGSRGTRNRCRTSTTPGNTTPACTCWKQPGRAPVRSPP